MAKQYVCKVCGYNMIGDAPHTCPFCGCNSSNFITAEECSKNFSITEKYVSNSVMQLKSSPKLGMEHAAYAIKTQKGQVWIDCPSCFEALAVKPVAICFTHHHFMGACNLYQKDSGCEIYIHITELDFSIAKQFIPFVTRQVRGDFWAYCEIDALHIAGHTPGYTAYFFKDICFACDITLLSEDEPDALNTYASPKEEVIPAVKQLIKECDKRKIKIICCYNDIYPYPEWKSRVQKLLKN